MRKVCGGGGGGGGNLSENSRKLIKMRDCRYGFKSIGHVHGHVKLNLDRSNRLSLSPAI